jgi:hypothetical protein
MADDDALDFDQENATALAEMLADPMTSEPVRLQIINSLLEDDRDATFFETMMKEAMSLANCPFCDHENYWLIPEDDLNQMGWVSFESDARVKANPTKEDCPEFQEACKKKKTTA